MPKDLNLLPRERLIRTSAVDRADWNYSAKLAWLQRYRFRLLLSLMAGEHAGRLLDLGYGSGILMPELATRCDELYGADPHDQPDAIREVMASQGISATLVSAGAEQLPFDDNFFDTIVTVSAIEYVKDIDAAGQELCRVLEPSGHLLIVTPGHSPLLDAALSVLTGESADENYGRNREQLLPALETYFRVVQIRRFPPIIGRLLPVYRAVKLAPR